MAFERIASLSEIPEGRGLCVRLDGHEVGLFRVGRRVYALDNLCPHAGYPLSEGELDGSFVVCPGHGWAFDVITGLGEGEVEEEPLQRWPVRVVGDEVWIDLEG